MTEKVDLKRELRQLYSAPQNRCELLEVPELRYLAVDGYGDPTGDSDYEEVIQALYGVAYTLKFASKARGSDFVVMPLQGLWWSDDMSAFLTGSRDEWSWRMMILQPDWIDAAMVEEAVGQVRNKQPSPALERLRLEAYEEGWAAQTMHVGPYSEEAPTIERLHAFIDKEELVRRGLHHEIYLGDPRRTAPEKLKTIIRQPCGPAENGGNSRAPAQSS